MVTQRAIFCVVILLVAIMQGWGIALAIHAVVTYFIVDHAGGDFSALLDEYVTSKIPTGLITKIKSLASDKKE